MVCALRVFALSREMLTDAVSASNSCVAKTGIFVVFGGSKGECGLPIQARSAVEMHKNPPETATDRLEWWHRARSGAKRGEAGRKNKHVSHMTP